jgi:MOSC domain-containing protein YiiM
VLAGPVRTLHSPREPDGPATTWRSAILKSRQHDAVHIALLGLAGDAQKEQKHHGGPNKAVLIYGASHYAATWDASLGRHAATHAAVLRAMSGDVDASTYGFGAFGENLTVDSLTESTVYLGDVWRAGDCALRITEPRGPCATLTRRWMRPALLDEVKSNAAAGWYNAVVSPGAVQEGDAVQLAERVQTAWSIARVFELLESRVVSRASLAELIHAPFLHDELRARLVRRAQTPGRTRD